MKLNNFIGRWALAWVMMAVAVHADTLRLKNGNTIDGLVTQETDTQVTLGFATGSMSFPKSAIVAIERASEAENNQLQAEWKQKYFLHRKYTPPELTGLADAFARLVAQREVALNARKTLEDLPTKEECLRAEQESLRLQIVQTSNRLKQMTPSRSNVEVYNALVSESNLQQARWGALNSERTACPKEHDAAMHAIAAYQDSITAFGVRLEEERKKLVSEGSAKERKPFFDRLEGGLAGYLQEFASTEVNSTQSHGGTIVTVQVNDSAQGRFIVDTGATQVTISEEFARKLNLDPTMLPELENTLADGHKVKGRRVVFRSVAVGDARAENIEAVVFPKGPADQIDGLLGMSFLGNFSVNLDGSGKLILRKFAPKP